MTIKLSRTQEIILSAANQRSDGKIKPFPDAVILPGASGQKVIDAMLGRDFIEKDGDDYIITDAGRTIVGGKPEDSKSAEIPKDAEENPAFRQPKGKLGKMLEMINTTNGATLDELMKATGWQKHSVRGAISGQIRTKLKLNVFTMKNGDVTTYKIIKGDLL